MTKSTITPTSLELAQQAYAVARAEYEEAQTTALDLADDDAALQARLDSGDITVTLPELTASAEALSYAGRVARALREQAERARVEVTRQQAVASPDVAIYVSQLLSDAARSLNLFGIPVEVLDTYPSEWPQRTPAMYVWQNEPTKHDRGGTFGGAAIVAIRSGEHERLDVGRLLHQAADLAISRGAKLEKGNVWDGKLAVFAGSGLRKGGRSDYSSPVVDGIATDLYRVTAAYAQPDVPCLPAGTVEVTSNHLAERIASQIRSYECLVGGSRYTNVVSDTEAENGNRLRVVVAEVPIGHKYDVANAVSAAHKVAADMSGQFVTHLGRVVQATCDTSVGTPAEGQTIATERAGRVWRLARFEVAFLYRPDTADADPGPAPGRRATSATAPEPRERTASHPGSRFTML